MTDLEQDLRDALHARGDAVTAADLRHAGAPRARRPRTRYYAPLAAAAAVVIIGGGAAAIVAHNTSNDTSAAGGNPTSSSQPDGRGGALLIGTRWRLTTVTIGTRPVAISDSPGARIEFSRRGRLTATDYVNGYSATYRPTGNGIDVGPLNSTLVGYVGLDSSVKAAETGIAAIHGVVLTEVVGNTLTLRAGHVTLTFTRIGDLDPGFTGVSAPPSGSGTPSPTGAPPSSTQSYVNGSELPASSGPS